jgi:hypothetical protein
MTAAIGRSWARGISGPDQSDVGPAKGKGAKHVALISFERLNGLNIFIIGWLITSDYMFFPSIPVILLFRISLDNKNVAI